MSSETRVRPIPVSADTRQYWWVSVSADTDLSIGADTGSPAFVYLSQQSTLCQHCCTYAYSFKPISYFRAYTHIHNLHSPIPRTKSHFQYKKIVQPSIGICICISITAADSIGYRAPARYRSNPIWDILPLHRVRKKGATLFLPVTPWNSNRFSKFFYHLTQQ